MPSLTNLDYGIIVGALVLMLIIGFGTARLASRSLEHYFMGGRNLPWYLLGVSGMSAWFDMTGTMIITSFIYVIGPLGLYIRGAGGLIALAFMLAYANKWGRRSGCMTYAEWNTYRFGTGASAEMIRLITASVGILMTIGALAYLVRGATLFMGLVFPVDPVLLTLGIFAFASVYTVLAGFYGMVLNDLLQGAIMITGSIVISVVAWRHVPDAAALATAAAQATGNPGWASVVPQWHTIVPKGYEAYDSFLMAAMFYLARGIIGGLAGGTGGGTSPLAFTARNPRESSMMCLVQSITFMFRCPLMIGFAILGLLMVSQTMPDSAAFSRAAEAIHAAQPDLTADDWAHYTSGLAHHPEQAPPGLVERLSVTLGANWQHSLPMVSHGGTVDPELILPAVILYRLTPGFRGLLLAALLSALMGGLSSQINSTSALFVRDIYQNFIRKKADNRELIMAAYLSSIAVVVVGFVMGLHASSINDLWIWFIMSMTAGTMGPTMLRLYWWRTNAWGMACGLAAGGAGAFLQRLLWPALSEWWQFGLMTFISLAATIVGSLLTQPIPTEVVRYFYQTTRPFGFWKPFVNEQSPETRSIWRREHRNDIIAVAIGLVWQVWLALIPMELLTHNLHAFFLTLPVFLAACVGLYFFWWKNLPSADERIPDFTGRAPVHSLDELKAVEKT